MKTQHFNIWLVSLFALLASGISFGQEKQELVQFSGVVVSIDSLERIPYASIMDKTTGTGTMTDYYGYFSLTTKPGDTLVFSSFGFLSDSYIIPDTLTEKSYSIIHVMIPDTLLLPQVDIYPWPSKEEFARAFVEMDAYDANFRQFKRSLSGEQINETARGLQQDARSAYSIEAQQRQTIIYTQNYIPVNNLLNPISWAKFVNAWKRGDLQRE